MKFIGLKTLAKLLMAPTRINRAHFLLRYITLMVCIAIVSLFFKFIDDFSSIHKYNYIYLKLFFNFIILPPVAIFLGISVISTFVSRLHDINRSGWWLILVFFILQIPLVGPAIILFLFILYPGTKGQNIFGEQPMGGGELLNNFRNS